ncbi:MAG: hypothetical protein HDR88_11875 [Bacteroides sp.]|nr:hypothetical protein [Bacteroides sp.]
MYLSFISDIAKPGDFISVECADGTIQGTVVKLSDAFIAIKLDNGALIVKKDEEIANVVLNPATICNQQDRIVDVKSSTDVKDDIIDTTPRAKGDKVRDIPIACESVNLTIGQYESIWDSIDKSKLIASIGVIKKALTKELGSIIVASNANVIEVCKRSIRVNTKEHPKLSVSTSTIIELELMNDIDSFNIGDSLPVVIYFHNIFESKTAFLTLLPNSISGYVDLLEDAIESGHYRQAKSLCYFLLSHITEGLARTKLLSITRILKPVNAFLKEKQETRKGSIKIPKPYKKIEKEINDLVRNGNLQEAIAVIDESLSNLQLDSKYKSSLLLRKAQAFSSLKDYSGAKQSYIELISYKENTDGESRNLSHLYTELARLHAIQQEYEEALIAVTKALNCNPDNKYASTLVDQLRNGELNSVSVSSVADTPRIESSEKSGELILDSEETSFAISKMIDLDIIEHKYTNDSILANSGKPTLEIAEKLLKEAQAYKGTNVGEKYPLFLEAAKAYSELPVGSYDVSKYMESVAFYAVYKGHFLYNKFKNDIETNDSVNIATMKAQRDSACSYYIESLNLLSDVKGSMVGVILCNYLKLNIMMESLNSQTPIKLTGNLNRIFFSCINSDNSRIIEIAWNTVIAVCAASTKAWNQLWRYNSAWRRTISSAFDDDTIRHQIFKIIAIQNKCKVSYTNKLTHVQFLKKVLAFRQERLAKCAELQAAILKEDLDFHLLTKLLDKWMQMSEYVDLMNETETISKSIVDNILSFLTPYTNRNQVERTNLLIQAQAKIDEQIRFINENTTFYGRTFFFPLLKKWRRAITKLLEKKIADTLPQLIVMADPPYIVETNGIKIVNLLIKNCGESTAEGYKLTPTLTEIATRSTIKVHNNVEKEIQAGGIQEMVMKLPPEMSNAKAINLSMAISAIYQGKEVEPALFDFTVEMEPVASLSYEEIPWNDGPIPAEKMFKGRKQIIDMLTKHYTSIEKDKPYILYGLTRTGKSSILNYLRKALDKTPVMIQGDQYTIATFEWDLSQASSYGNASDMWEYLLYSQLNDYLKNYIGEDGVRELGMSDSPRAKDLKNTLDFLHKKRIYPMFFVDEFSFIKVMMDNKVLNPAFLHTLRQFSFEGKAGFIYAGTYDVDALLEDPAYGITGQLVGCKKAQINEIDRISTEELIQVLGNKLIFTEEAVKHIHMLSGDVPYFVQMICKYCGFYAVENKRTIIGYPELENVVQILTGERPAGEDSLVKSLPENVFQNNMFSPADPREVNVLISSICHFNRYSKYMPRGISMVELQELWATKNITAFRPKLADSIELLCKKKVLSVYQDEELPVYTLNVDLFRRWWTVHHPDIALEIDTIL